MMKKFHFLMLIFLISIGYGFAQERLVHISFENMGHFSKITDESIETTWSLGNQGLFRCAIKPNNKRSLTIGLGFINTGVIFDREFDPIFGATRERTKENYGYLFMPVGFKFSDKKHYFISEIGIGYNLTKNAYVTTWTGTDKIKFTYTITQGGTRFNKRMIPLMLSFGRVFMVKKFEVALGIKGYYDFDQMVYDSLRNNHHYGLGLVLGIGFDYLMDLKERQSYN